MTGQKYARLKDYLFCVLLEAARQQAMAGLPLVA